MAEKLTTYKRKRDFAATPEPAGEPEPAAQGNRFVVQEHHARRLHWDLRLERDGVLPSWAVPNGIPLAPDENRKAVRTEDHPLEYIDFQGEIPAGQYGAGTVKIWDRGTYECHKWEPRKVIVTFHGEKLRGRYALFQTGGEQDWMIHRMDPPERGREPMPERIVPMMAQLTKMPARDEGWAWEVKWDGVRVIAYVRPGRLQLESRNLRDITAGYLEVRGLTRALGAREAVLDGELVAFDPEGRPSFERLQQRMHLTSESVVRRRMKTHPVSYVLFDLLYLDGRNLMEEPYTERRRLLEELDLNGDHWQTPSYNVGNGRELLEVAGEKGLEGLVGKRLESRYEPGRRAGSWIKVKNTARQELVIGGWFPGEGRRKDRIGALLVGYYDDGELRFAGKVGTGFSDKDLAGLAARLRPLERESSPFSGRQPQRGAVFIEPELVAEVEFTEWTKERLLRHPSFKGLRDDKDPREVRLERPVEAVAAPGGLPARALEGGAVEVTVDGRAVRLSNLDKVLYPKTGFTKGELIDYYARIANLLLPHLQGRPLTLKRGRGKEKGHRVVNDLATLIGVADLAEIELNTSLSLAESPERPTAMVFDLDPGKPANMSDCCEVALWIRGMLAELDLEVYAKTSGWNGLQLYVPLNGEVTYERTKGFARAVAQTLEQQFPDRVVSRTAKKLRRGMVLVDWSRNDQHKSMVAVYSVRAGERPTVSTPLRWEEVEAGDPERLAFEVEAVLDRAADHGDLFAPVLSERQELPELGG